MENDNSIYISEINNLKQNGFERIAKAIELLWGEDELNEYFVRLIMSDRETRQGFPEKVFMSILKLYKLHDKKTIDFGDWRDNFGK